MIECEHCGSHNVRLDYIEGYQGPQEMVCMMCGRKNIKEVEMSKKKVCEVEGCERQAVTKGVCYTHYHERYGKVYKPETPRISNKELRQERMKALRKEIAEQEQKKTNEVYDWKTIPTPIITIPVDRLLIDFTGYEDLLEAIKANAQNEMRSPEMQILWIIKTLLDKAA